MNISAPSITSQSYFSPLVSVQIVLLLLGIALSKLFLRVYNLNIEYWAGVKVGCDSSFFCVHYFSVFHIVLLRGVTKITVEKEKRGRHKY